LEGLGGSSRFQHDLKGFGRVWKGSEGSGVDGGSGRVLEGLGGSGRVWEGLGRSGRVLYKKDLGGSMKELEGQEWFSEGQGWSGRASWRVHEDPGGSRSVQEGLGGSGSI
jgi:hypothetical protein